MLDLADSCSSTFSQLVTGPLRIRMYAVTAVCLGSVMGEEVVGKFVDVLSQALCHVLYAC